MSTPEITLRGQPQPLSTRSSPVRFLMMVLGIGTLVIFGAWKYFQHELHRVPVNTTLTVEEFVIEEGTNARETAVLLAQEKVVSSESLFFAAILLYFDPGSIKAGTYRLSGPLSMYDVATQITNGNVVHNLVTMTHIEGERASLLASRVAKLLPNFDAAEFLILASSSEGRLYPDTYYVDKDFTAEDVFTLLRNTYTDKITPLQVSIENHDLTEDQILILASIVEREANTETSMKMVAGILQNRLRIGMALQADATIEYVLDKNLNELTPEDLKRDTPYNTYLYPGLPPTPIGNPGLLAIKAVLEPTLSTKLFYITGDDGVFYYAENFDQHRANITRHLR